MSNVPEALRYARSHEWIRAEDDGTVTVGITDYAQESLGDLVFVELPETGASVDAGDACAVVESVKAASDIYAPVAGEVIEVNDRLADEPELINADPFGEGWIMKLQPATGDALEGLLDAEGYRAVLAEAE
jgi:glycine cleavage system H protein